jgi:hypothetical protein
MALPHVCRIHHHHFVVSETFLLFLFLSLSLSLSFTLDDDINPSQRIKNHAPQQHPSHVCECACANI